MSATKKPHIITRGAIWGTFDLCDIIFLREVIMKANQIKVLFIKWLLKNNPNSIIGNEVLFSNNLCRTDILQIINNKTVAYEIKSDSDNLDCINEQLNNYLKTFDYTYLVFTEKYPLNKLETLDSCIGLYLIEQNGYIKQIRRAKLSKSITKSNLLCFIPKKELIELLNKKGLSGKSVFELRLICEKLSFKKVKQKSIDILNNRYSKLLNLFLYDTEGENITIDDLTSLTGNLYTDELR